jgi:signal transduction histidine kinase
MTESSAPISASGASDQNGSTIRSQLLWASVFPLIFFGLLTILVTSTALYELTLKNAVSRNTAQVQLMSDAVELQMLSGLKPDTASLLNILHAVNPDAQGQLYLFDAGGNLLQNTIAAPETVDLAVIQSSLITGYVAPTSKLLDSTIANEKNLVSIAAMPSGKQFVIFSEPWSEILAPTLYYQLIFIGLWILGITFSLGMLSVSISRIIRPIAILVENATGAVPGSIFHPVPQHGPKEIRALTNEFNQMVIRLAEQQRSLRQYAHKALLSQEEERQRLSHELHDGTLQDLVGLIQRVELCRNDLDTNPAYAKQRLDDLHDLLNKTIEDIRRMSIALRPPVLEDFGLPIALEALCKDLQQEKPDLLINYVVLGENQRLQSDLELAVYRVVQEALTNIRKHVKDVSEISVELEFTETEVKAVITNNGAVFSNYDVNRFVQSGHLGLAGMYERARLFGGSLAITTNADNNTVVCIQMPYLQ